MLTILYIHGFNSAGTTTTAAMLRRALPDANVISNSYPHHYPVETYTAIFNDVVDTLVSLGPTDELVVVGTSTGGFWAEVMHRLVGVKTLVINPARHPGTQLKKHLGTNINYSTGASEEFTEGALDEYSIYESSLKFPPNRKFPFIGVLFTGDEVVDNKDNSKEICDFGEVWTVIGGSHRVSQNEIDTIVSAITELENTVVGELD